MWTWSLPSRAMLGYLPVLPDSSKVSTSHWEPSNQAYSKSHWDLSWYAMCGLSALSTAMETDVPM